MNRILFFVLACLLLVGCSGSKKVIKAPVKEQGAAFLTNALEQHQADFNTLKAKVAITINADNQNIDLRGQLRMRKDSLIWLSLSKAGLEVYRVKLTPDSLFLLNRMGKQYLEDPIESVYNVLNNALDYDMIQAFLTGNDFSLYEKGSFKADYNNQMYRLTTSDRRKLKKHIRMGETPPSIPLQSIWLNPETYKIEMVMIKEITQGASRKLTAEYDHFKMIDSTLYPHTMNFIVDAEEKYGLEIDFSKVEFNVPLRYPFSVSSKYERITFIKP